MINVNVSAINLLLDASRLRRIDIVVTPYIAIELRLFFRLKIEPSY